MNTNERRATPDVFIWGAPLRDGSFFRPAALLLTHVQQAHFVRNALQRQKNSLVATTKINVNRPLTISLCKYCFFTQGRHLNYG